MRLPNLLKGEKIILWSQSSLCMRDSWQEGYVFLTNRRLIFNQVTKLTYETRLNDIIKVSIEKRPWFFGVRVRQVCIDFRTVKGIEKIYLALAKPKKWGYKIKESMTLMLAEGWGCNGANTKPAGDT